MKKIYDNVRTRMVLSILFSCALLAGVGFVAIFSTILWHGFERLNLQFITTPTVGGAGEGGILYQIVGTLILVGTAALLVIPFSMALSVTFYFDRSRQWIRRWTFFWLQVLNATPSIVFGIMGFIFFVKGLRWDKSWLAGGAILAVMMLPTVVTSLVERLETIPESYIETALALGFDEDRLIWTVLLPYAWGGLLTGLIVGIARIAGETAPIMLTAAVYSGATFPSGFKSSPVLALPYHIFQLVQDMFGPGAMKTAWATAAVLTCVVLSISTIAIPFRARSHEEAKI